MAVKTNDCVVSLSDFTADGKEIFASIKNTAIMIDGLTSDEVKSLNYYIQNNKLVISYGESSIKVSNYTGIKYIKTDYQKTGKNEFYNLFDLISNSVIDNTLYPINTLSSPHYNTKKLTVTGTNYNDKIDYSKSEYIPKGSVDIKNNKGLTISGGDGNDEITGTNYNDVIIGGNGNDAIIGSDGSDTITGGTGKNIIKYTSLEQLAGDKIYLTKGEELTIDASKIEGTPKYEVAGNNLVISYNEGGDVKTLTLMNFGTKDVTNNTTKITIDTSKVILVTMQGNVDLRTQKVIAKNGTWHNDVINRSDYEIRDKKGVLIENTVTRGLTLNGGIGNDEVTGTRYSDTISAGTGNDKINAGSGNDIIYAVSGNNEITGGKGNDKIYSGTENDTFHFNVGDGNDIIVSGKGEDTIHFGEGITLDTITLNANSTRSDLIINYGNGDSIALSGYLKNKATSSIKYVRFGDSEAVDISKAFKGIEITYGSVNEIKNQTLTGTNDKDVIIGGLGNDVIKANGGDDIITGGVGNDTIAGGNGTNIIKYAIGDGDDKINLTKGENFTLELSDLELSDLTFEYAGKNMKISYSKTDKTGNLTSGSITLNNFATTNVTNNANLAKKLEDTSSVMLKIGDKIYDLRSNEKDGNYWYEIKVKDNFKGGWLNDHINATTADEKKDKKGNHVDIVLNGGSGDDLIESSNYADKITGGTGKNTIRYSSLEQLAGDKIYLTKGEQLDIDISKITGAVTAYNVNGKNLDIIVTKDEKSATFTIINFGTLDVTNNATKKMLDTSWVKLITDNSANPTIDLRKEVEVISTVGTYHNDIINKSDYDVWDDKKKTIRSTNWSKTGLTINGLAGNDTIVGTDYSDKIYTGIGNDTISAGLGNNYLYFNKGDGNDIVENGGGVDTLVFAKNTKLEYKYDGYDLIIKYSDNDTVTLKDYLKGHSVQYIQIGSDKINFTPDKPKFNEYDESGYHVIEGTEIADIIIGTSRNDKIYGDNGSDIINAGHGNDIIDGGSGNNTYIFNTGDSNDTIINGNGTDTIKFNSVQTLSYSRTLSNNDLVISYGNNDSIVLQNYFVRNSHSTKTILNGAKELNIASEIAKGYSIIGTNSKDIFDGASNIPYTYVVKGGNDIIQNSKSTDTIKLDTQLELNYSKTINSDDLVITYGSNTVTIKDYFKNEKNSIQKIEGLNGEIIKLQEELLKGIELLGTNNNDSFETKENVPCKFVLNGGNDILKTTKESDTLYFSPDVTLKIEPFNGKDIVIHYGESDSVTIKNYSTKYNSSVQTILHGDKSYQLADLIIYDKDCIISGGNNIFASGDYVILSACSTDKLQFNYDPFYKNVNSHDLVLKNQRYVNGAFVNEETVLKDYFKYDTYPIDVIIDGGREYSLKYKLSYCIIQVDTGHNSNDILIGEKNRTCRYSFEVGDGNDTVINFDGNDYLHFDPSVDIKLSKDFNNNDLKITYSENDSVVVKDYFINTSDSAIYKKSKTESSWQKYYTNLVINGTDDNDNIESTSMYKNIIYAGNGNDTINISSGGSTVYVGKGKDTIINSTGGNMYVFENGDGDNIITNTNNYYQNTIKFSEYHNLKFYQDSQDLIINYNAGDSIRLTKYFSGFDMYLLQNGGTTSHISASIDYIADVNSSNKTYSFINTSGTTTIVSGLGNDTLMFVGNAKLSYTHNLSDDNLIINYGDGNNVIVKDYFTKNHSVKYIQKNKTKTDLESEVAKYLINVVENSANKKISITEGNYLVSATSGLLDISFPNNDKISYEHGENNDLIIRYNSQNTVTIKDYYSRNNFELYKISGTSAGCIFNCGDRDSVISAASGKDKFICEGGNKTFIFGKNSGDDIIEGKCDSVTLKFTDYTKDSLTFSRDKNNKYIITYGSDSEKSSIQLDSLDNVYIQGKNDANPIHVSDFMLLYLKTGEGTDFNDDISFDKRKCKADGSDSHSIDIHGGKGNDIIHTYVTDQFGHYYSTSLYFDIGDGIDTVYAAELSCHIKSTLFATSQDSDGNLVITYSFDKYGNSVDKIITPFDEKSGLWISWDYGKQYGYDTYRSYFSYLDGDISITDNRNNTTLNKKGSVYEQSLGVKIGTDGDDHLTRYESEGNIPLYGKDGDDILFASNGGYLYGGAGNDCYKLHNFTKETIYIQDAQGDNDIIDMMEQKADNLTLYFDLENVISSNTYSMGSDLCISNSYNDTIIKDYFTEDGKIETIKCTDGIVTDEQINIIAQSVASWLVKNDYTSTIEAKADPNVDLSALYAAYKTPDASWQIIT